MSRQDREPEVPRSSRRVDTVGGHVAHDDTAELSRVLVLGPGEHWALDQVRRHGVGLFIALMSVAATVVTVTIMVTWLTVRGRWVDQDDWVPAMVMAVVLPMALAPPLLLVSARLVARLDTAMQLLRVSAVTDPLTGVANRRGFFAGLDRLADDDEIEVAMIDLDSFKALNDRYGHATGDAALRAVATWLSELVGEQGIVGRIGGDEFAFAAVADAFRIVPARQRFDVGEISFTVSIGRAVGSGADTEAALLAADESLYEQKRSRPIVRSDRRPHRPSRSYLRSRGQVEP